jgi:hypothetical protein
MTSERGLRNTRGFLDPPRKVPQSQVLVVKTCRTFALGRSEVRQIQYHHVPNEIPGRVFVAPFAQAL